MTSFVKRSPSLSFIAMSSEDRGTFCDLSTGAIGISLGRHRQLNSDARLGGMGSSWTAVMFIVLGSYGLARAMS